MLVWGALGAVACRPEPTTYDSAGLCRTLYGLADEGDRYAITVVPSDEWPEGVTLEVIYPEAEPLLPDGAPVVVVADGGWDTDAVPVEGAQRVLMEGKGMVQIYLNLPGGTTGWSTPGEGDFRGASARKALWTAVAYGAGGLVDDDGCTLADRMQVPLSRVGPVLHGQSNGGNLTLASLADHGLDFPPLSGLSFFETPAGPQFVSVEFGTPEAPNPTYSEGTCTWSEEDGLTCPLDYTSTLWASTLRSNDGATGAVCYDLDGNGTCVPGTDLPIWGVRPKVDGAVRTVFSPPLTAWVESKGWLVEDLLGSTESREFWSTRDGSRSAAAAMARSPVPAVVIGTSTDHMLAVHDHVTGLALALRETGSPWVRVNPDASYVALLEGQEAPWADNPANSVTAIGEPTSDLEPDEEELDILSRSYVTAAAMELFERTWVGDWAPNLDARLAP